MSGMNPPFTLRQATPDDANALAELTNFAGEGLPLYLWERMAEEGETGWDVGRRRARGTDAGYSYANALVAEVDGKLAACLIGYPIPDEPEEIDYSATPPIFVPLQELENLAPATWYVNILAAYPEHRNRGLGTGLLETAEELAAKAACEGLSIIVSDANSGARRLYERRGYTERASRPMVKEGWQNPGRNWVLLIK